MQNSRFLMALGGFGMAPALTLALSLGMLPVAAREGQPASGNNAPGNAPGNASGNAPVQRLAEMFSPQIRSTINACWEQGKVNLAAGAGQNGRVTCGNGSVDSQVAYNDYLDTVSNILAASSLVGFRAVMQSDTRITPEMLIAFLSNAQGQSILRNTIQTAITQSQLLPPQGQDSNELLTNEVISRLMPALREPQQIQGLLGTSEQYSKVVADFCTAPGMSVADAISNVPGLNPIQLYAICIQESGVTNDVLQQVQ